MPRHEYGLEAGAGPSDDEPVRPVYVRAESSSSGSRGPLEKLFRKRFKNSRRSPDRHEREQDSHPVPDITVESPVSTT